MNMKTTKDLLNDFQYTRNLKKETVMRYATSIRLYENFNEMSMIDLLNEAEHEEENGTRWKYRTLKKRLLNFRTFLNQNYKKNYAKITLTRIITVYTHYELEVHKLPPVSSKNYIESTPITYSDLPDKEVIRNAYNLANNQMKAVILFMSSSGCARAETLNITIKDFIEATREYHNKDNILDVLNVLKELDDVIPTFKVKRVKTGKYYYTFCSPEAVREIVNYLLSERIETIAGKQKAFRLNDEDKLFNKSIQTMNRDFQDLNDTLQLGKRGGFNRLRSHMLRKFHASALKNNGMDKYDVNSLQGKGLNSTDEAYFFDDPKVLKEKFLEHLEAVTILGDVDVVSIKSPEFINLEMENKRLRKKEGELLDIYKRLEALENK